MNCKIRNIICIAFIGIFITSCDSQFKKNEDPVNIIYILADDLGYADLSCYGQRKFSTPNIDKLAKNGLKFNQHYSGSTVCAPSRSALLTGFHTGHAPIRGNHEIMPEGQFPMADSVFTIMELLKQNSYTTGVFGKWGLGYPGSEGDPNNQGVDQFYGYNCQRLAHNYYPRYLWDNDQKHVLSGNQGQGKEQYAPHLIHNRAMQFIRNNQEKPFFMFYASPLPHAELAADEDLIAKYRDKFGQEKPYKGYDEGEKYRAGPYESQAEPHAAYAAMVETLDRQVGEIVAELKALGLDKNTLIIFSSDNGPHTEGGGDPAFFESNGPFKGVKRDLYEGGIRVPMIAYWPETIEPGESEHVSAFWDVLPTVQELIGANKVESIDGLSFLPTLMGESEKQERHDHLYWEFHEKGGRIAVRKNQWKAVKYNVLKNPDARIQLYDVETDPGEENNLAKDHPDIVEKMQKIMNQARTESPVFAFGSSTYLAN